MQTYANHYYSESYRRVFGATDKGRPSKGGSGGGGIPKWKSMLMFAAQSADGSLLPSEVAQLKKWSLTDFFDLVEIKMEYAEERAK